MMLDFLINKEGAPVFAERIQFSKKMATII